MSNNEEEVMKDDIRELATRRVRARSVFQIIVWTALALSLGYGLGMEGDALARFGVLVALNSAAAAAIVGLLLLVAVGVFFPEEEA